MSGICFVPLFDSRDINIHNVYLHCMSISLCQLILRYIINIIVSTYPDTKSTNYPILPISYKLPSDLLKGRCDIT